MQSITKGYLDIINLDLPRKVRYKKRVKRQNVTTKDTKIRLGRTYSNFKDYIKYYNDSKTHTAYSDGIIKK